MSTEEDPNKAPQTSGQEQEETTAVHQQSKATEVLRKGPSSDETIPDERPETRAEDAANTPGVRTEYNTSQMVSKRVQSIRKSLINDKDMHGDRDKAMRVLGVSEEFFREAEWNDFLVFRYHYLMPYQHYPEGFNTLDHWRQELDKQLKLKSFVGMRSANLKVALDEQANSFRNDPTISKHQLFVNMRAISYQREKELARSVGLLHRIEERISELYRIADYKKRKEERIESESLPGLRDDESEFTDAVPDDESFEKRHFISQEFQALAIDMNHDFFKNIDTACQHAKRSALMNASKILREMKGSERKLVTAMAKDEIDGLDTMDTAYNDLFKEDGSINQASLTEEYVKLMKHNKKLNKAVAHVSESLREVLSQNKVLLALLESDTVQQAISQYQSPKQPERNRTERVSTNNKALSLSKAVSEDAGMLSDEEESIFIKPKRKLNTASSNENRRKVSKTASVSTKVNSTGVTSFVRNAIPLNSENDQSDFVSESAMDIDEDLPMDTVSFERNDSTKRVTSGPITGKCPTLLRLAETDCEEWVKQFKALMQLNPNRAIPEPMYIHSSVMKQLTGPGTYLEKIESYLAKRASFKKTNALKMLSRNIGAFPGKEKGDMHERVDEFSRKVRHALEHIDLEPVNGKFARQCQIFNTISAKLPKGFDLYEKGRVEQYLTNGDFYDLDSYLLFVEGKIDQAIVVENVKGNSSGNTVSSPTDRKEQSAAINALSSKVQNLANQITNSQNTTQPVRETASDKCPRCGRRNHTANTCKFKTAQCKICNGIGHVPKMCPSKSAIGYKNEPFSKKKKPKVRGIGMQGLIERANVRRYERDQAYENPVMPFVSKTGHTKDVYDSSTYVCRLDALMNEQNEVFDCGVHMTNHQKTTIKPQTILDTGAMVTCIPLHLLGTSDRSGIDTKTLTLHIVLGDSSTKYPIIGTYRTNIILDNGVQRNTVKNVRVYVFDCSTFTAAIIGRNVLIDAGCIDARLFKKYEEEYIPGETSGNEPVPEC